MTRQGTTLIELLLAVVFLGVCSAALLNLTANSRGNATYASRRAAVLAQIEAEVVTARLNVPRLGLMDIFGYYDTNSRNVNVPGIPGNVTITRTTAAPALSNLFTVQVEAKWTEPTPKGSRTDRLITTTLVKEGY